MGRPKALLVSFSSKIVIRREPEVNRGRHFKLGRDEKQLGDGAEVELEKMGLNISRVELRSGAADAAHVTICRRSQGRHSYRPMNKYIEGLERKTHSTKGEHSIQ
jgi:hypothetical protein